MVFLSDGACEAGRVDESVAVKGPSTSDSSAFDPDLDLQRLLNRGTRFMRCFDSCVS